MTTTPASRTLPPVALVALVIVVGIVLVRIPILAGGQTWADLRYHAETAPPRLAAADAVLSGELPAWWEGTGLGVPLAAEPSHGALYPPTWIAGTPRSLDLLVILHLAWAALGVALWARRKPPGFGPRGASEPGAVVAGLLVATSGIFASAALRGALPGLAHLPWIGLAATALADSSTPRERARSAIAIALLVGAIALAGALALVVDAIAIACVLGARRATWSWLGGAILVGLGLGLAQWLPALLHLGTFAGGADVHGLPFSRLLELVVPGNFGGSDPTRTVESIAGTHAWAPSLFVGAPLLALAAIRPPRGHTTALVIAFATLALVVGRGGWPAWAGAPELHIGALVVILGPRAATGLDTFVAGDRRAVLTVGIGAVFATVALGAVAAQRARDADAGSAFDRALLDGGLGLACMTIALAIAWRAGRTRVMRSDDESAPIPRGSTAIALALLVLPTVGATPSIAPTMDRSLVEDPPPFAVAALAHPGTGAAPRRAYRPQYMFAFEDDRRTTETTADALATFAGASAWRWDVAAARSEDPARLPEHDRFWLAAANEGGALLDRFGIALAILPETLIVPRGLVALAKRGKWALAALPVAPPAAVLHGVLWNLDPDETMRMLYPGGGGMGILPGTLVLRGRGPTGERHPDRGPPRPCEVHAWARGAIDLTCTSDAPGFAAVSSTPMPGWEVTVDGEPARWLVADVIRRAVQVPAGTHRIAWRYRTPGLTTGILVAIVLLLGLVALAITTRRPRAPKSAVRDDEQAN